ncbi:MAG: ABC transporter substrate-binding protein [Nitrospirae bacterium]|nr:ABC transporter substrate-binding protein [Nitrospirota bacterium]
MLPEYVSISLSLSDIRGGSSITKTRHYLTLAVLIVFQFAAALAVYGADGGMKAASFVPQWLPQAQFAGFYVALDKGFYKKYGVDLKIITGGPERPPFVQLKEGRADFALMELSSAIAMLAKGQRLINIAQVVRQNSQMIVARKASGIVTVDDLNGMKLSVWGGDYGDYSAIAFLKRHHIKAHIVNQSASVDLFMRGAVDAAVAMSYNDYHNILNSGLDPGDLVTFAFHDYGVDFPEDGLYVSEQRHTADPELSCAFVRASVEGWLYAFAHPDEALDIVMKYMIEAHVPSNKAHQKWMLTKMRELIIPDNDTTQIGILRREDYEHTAGQLKADGLIETVTPYESFYKNCVKK